MHKIFIRVCALCIALFCVPAMAGKKLYAVATKMEPVVMEPNASSLQHGFLVDILTHSLAQLGYELEIEYLPYERLLWAVDNKTADLVIGGCREQNKGWVQPSISYAPNQTYLISRSDSEFSFDGIASLSKYRLNVVSGFDYADQSLHDFIKAADGNNVEELHHVDANRAQIMQLLNGRADVIAVGDLPFRYTTQKYGMDSEDFNKIYKGGVFKNIVAINPDVPEAQALSAAITREYLDLRKSGELEKILSQYGVPLWDKELEALN